MEISRLIAAELAGTNTAGGREELDAWLAEDPAHRAEYEAIAAGLRGADGRYADRKRVAKEWAGFERRVRPVRLRVISVLRYSAVAAVMVAAVLLVRNISGEKPGMTAAGEGEISLVLNNGDRLALDNDDCRILSSRNGVRVVLQEDALVYDVEQEGDGIAGLDTLVIPNGRNIALRLADGTKIWLNAGSRLVYPPVFPDSCRQVEILGEGYFEVAHDAQRPFVVEAGGVEIRVLGTSFNVSSYDNTIETTLLEGSVELTCGEERVRLAADQQAVWNGAGGTFSVREVEARNYALWREGIFWFEDADLASIMGELTRWYGMTVVYRNPELRWLRFSVELERYDDIELVMNKIKLTKRVDYEIKGETIELF